MPTLTATRVGRFLDGLEWAYQTRPRRALGFDFAVRVMDRALGGYLDTILVGNGHDGTPEHTYSLVDRGPGSPRQFALFLDGRSLGPLRTPRFALSYLLWHLNQTVVEQSQAYVLLHSAAVEQQGRGVLLPAPMDAGKTTLAAGLVQSGYRYLTDETVGIDTDTLHLTPYPKALSVDPGSWDVLATLRPSVDDRVSMYLGDRWHIAPETIRPGSVSPGCEPRFIIAPQYRKGWATTLTPMSRAEAVVVLAENCFNLKLHGGAGLEVLARVARRSCCFRLTVGRLDEACHLIQELIDGGGGGS